MNMHEKKILDKIFFTLYNTYICVIEKKNWQQPTRCLSNHGMLIYIEEKNEIFLLNT